MRVVNRLGLIAAISMAVSGFEAIGYARARTAPADPKRVNDGYFNLDDQGALAAAQAKRDKRAAQWQKRAQARQKPGAGVSAPGGGN